MQMHIAILESTKLNFIKQLSAHPFLERCRNGMVTLNELKTFMVQQGIYSSYFTRYLCAMMANLPSNHEVLKLAENLFEELGLAPQSPTPHYLIYRNMLDVFSLSLDTAQPSIGTQQLIHTMFKYCRDQNPAYGLGALCLGAEALVPELYADIIKGFKHCGIDDKDIEFFYIHVGCDDGHAETLRNIMVDLASSDHAQIDRMVKAGLALVNARLAFFSSLDDINSKKFPLQSIA